MRRRNPVRCVHAARLHCLTLRTGNEGRCHKQTHLELSVLATGHPFCAECICRWRRSSWRCPVCRVVDNRRLRPAGGAGVTGAGSDGSRLRAVLAHTLERSGGSALDLLSGLLEARAVLCCRPGRSGLRVLSTYCAQAVVSRPRSR